MDHFSYEVAYSKDWHLSTWYDARKFDKWFGTLSNRRAREIMPLLHIVSSDDEDRTDGGPSSDGQESSGQSGPTTQEGGNTDQPDNPGPSQDDRNQDMTSEGQGGNTDMNEDINSAREIDPQLRLAQDNALFRKLGFNKFYLLPHAILVKGAGNVIFRWFKFTLKPPYTITHGNLLLAIWDTSHWTSFVKFGLTTA